MADADDQAATPTDEQTAEQATTEDEAVAAARARSDDDAVPSPALGSFLAWLARGVGARTAVEVGSAAGVSGLWLLRGLTDRGVLTSVEGDPHRHGLATQAYAEAGVSSRIRAIEGEPSDVLPRLAEDSYDLVLLQPEDRHDPAELVEHGLRLLSPGGLLAARGLRPKEGRSVVRGLVGDDEDGPLERLLTDEALDATPLPDIDLVLARYLPTDDDA